MKSNDKMQVFWRGAVIEKKHSASFSSDESESIGSENPFSPDQNRLLIKEEDDEISLANYRRVKRLRANDRERRRVHLINCAMESLRNVVPGLREKRKLTKLDLLRAANQYIWLLDEALRTGRSVEDLSTELQRMQDYSRNFQRIYYMPHHTSLYVKRENMNGC